MFASYGVSKLTAFTIQTATKPATTSAVFSMFGGGAKKEKKEEDEDRGDVSGSAKAQRQAAAAAEKEKEGGEVSATVFNLTTTC